MVEVQSKSKAEDILLRKPLWLGMIEGMMSAFPMASQKGQYAKVAKHQSKSFRKTTCDITENGEADIKTQLKALKLHKRVFSKFDAHRTESRPPSIVAERAKK